MCVENPSSNDTEVDQRTVRVFKEKVEQEGPSYSKDQKIGIIWTKITASKTDQSIRRVR